MRMRNNIFRGIGFSRLATSSHTYTVPNLNFSGLKRARTMSLSQCTSKFAVDLFRILSPAEEDAFCSPVSIALALGMCYAGSAGGTSEQLKSVLFSGVRTDSEVHEGFQAVLARLNDCQEGLQLHTANRLYAQAKYKILDSFRQSLKSYYSTELQLVDFEKESEAVRNAINDWVAATTNNKITNLIMPGVLTALTRLVLVNAIYFKGDWKDPFDKANTIKKPFYSSQDDTLSVEMMQKRKGRYRYGEDEDLNVQVLGIPYVGNHLYFFVLLPKERFGLPATETKLTGEKLLRVVQHTYFDEVTVELPKFKLEHAFDLGSKFEQLGLTDMFNESKADFSLISTEKPPIFVSAVIHKAFIEVNEEGSEAAAATAIVMVRCALATPSQKPLEFIADHPFLFAIVDMQNAEEKQILFLGRLVKP